MNTRTLLQDQLGATHQILVRSVGDVSAAESRQMPIATLSPVIWHLGHLVVIDGYIARKAGRRAAAMGKLIYSMLTSLDGYVEDEHGRFGWGAPEDEEVHSYIN